MAALLQERLAACVFGVITRKGADRGGTLDLSLMDAEKADSADRSTWTPLVGQEGEVPGSPGGRNARVRLPVLMYHRVAPDAANESSEFTISPHQFERQLRWLARCGYVGIRPSDWLRCCRHTQRLPARPLLLTFDDAHAALAEYAFPMLGRYGFGAGVFVVTGCVGKTNAWDAEIGWGPYPLMTADQIRAWAAQGIEFGAHSRTHRELTTLSGTEVADEVAGSQEDLASILGASVVSFAYPYGCYNEVVRECVRSHFDMAFTAKGGVNTLRTDLHLLRRTMVLPGDGALNLAFRVRVGWSPGEAVRWGAFRTSRLFRAERRRGP